MSIAKYAAAIGRLKSVRHSLGHNSIPEVEMDFHWYLPAEDGLMRLEEALTGEEVYLFTRQQLQELLLPQHLDKILREE